MIQASAPLFEIKQSVVATVDLPAEYLPRFLAFLSDPYLVEIRTHQHRRSPSSTESQPRVCVELVFPERCSELDAVMFLDRLRRTPLPNSVSFALNSIFDGREAMILDLLDPSCLAPLLAAVQSGRLHEQGEDVGAVAGDLRDLDRGHGPGDRAGP